MQILSLAFAPDGRTIASGCGIFNDYETIGYVRLRDAATRRAIGHADRRRARRRAVRGAFARTAGSSRWPAATSSTSATWSSPRRPIVHRLDGHVNFVYAVAFQPGRPARGHRRLGQDHPALGPQRPASTCKP